MEKKLPGVFVNKIEKKIENNKSVYYGLKDEPKIVEKETSNEKKRSVPLNIRQKIKRVFQSEHYIYKMDVVLTMKDKKINKRVVGYNENDLITFENELIPISEILDIEIQKEN